MALEMVGRNYTMSDADLCMFVSNLCNNLTTDLAQLSLFGVTAPKILELKTLGDAFELYPSDDSYLGLVEIATRTKDEKAEEVRQLIRDNSTRFELCFGVKSGEWDRLGILNMNNFTDKELVFTGKRVVETSRDYLVQLADYGLTEDILDEMAETCENFELALNGLMNAINNRQEATKTRVKNGNELYAHAVKYCDIGKRYWYKRDPVKYNQYIIYSETSPGTLAAPQNLVFNYGSKVLWWDAVDNAVSYQLQWFDGSDYVEIYSGSDINFSYTPPDGLNKFRVRAHNAGGFGPWSEILEQYYFAVLPKAANLQIVQSGTIPTEGELTWNAVPTAVSYKVYQSVDNIGEYAAHWLVIGTVTEPLKSVTLTLGKRNSFRVETNNTYQTSMSDPVYIEV